MNEIPYYHREKYFELEKNPKYLKKIQNTNMFLEKNLNIKELNFFKALNKDYLENKENSIFARYFCSLNIGKFFNTNGGMYLIEIAYLEHIQIKNDLSNKAYYEILQNGHFLMNYVLHNDDFLIYYEGNYYSYDDEGFFSTIGETITTIPNLFITEFKNGEFLNCFDEVIDFSDYIIFCKNLDIDFKPSFDENFFSSYEEIKNLNINFKNCSNNITNIFLEKFIHDLKNEIKINQFFFKNFNFEISYLEKYPKNSELYYKVIYQNRIFFMSYIGLIYELKNDIIKPYCADLMSIPYYLMKENHLTTNDFKIYEKWLNNKNYLIDKDLNLHNLFWKYCSKNKVIL